MTKTKRLPSKNFMLRFIAKLWEMFRCSISLSHYNFVIFEERYNVTDLQATKIRLAKTILDTNNVALIEAVDKVLREVHQTPNSKIIGSNPDETPLLQQDLKDGIAISEQQIKDGKYSTIEQLAKKWNIDL